MTPGAKAAIAGVAAVLSIYWVNREESESAY